MRGVSEEENSAVPQSLQQALMETIVAEPHQFVRRVADQRADTLVHRPPRTLVSDDRVALELPIDAPDIVRLRMDEDVVPGVRRVVEEEPWLAREGQLRANVGDQKPVRIGRSREGQPQQLAGGARRAVAGPR